MREVKFCSSPDWTEIFSRHPELQPPGYEDAKQRVADKRKEAESERIRALMQKIHKEKISQKNKERSRRLR